MSQPIDHSSLIAALGGGSDVASGLESVGAEVRALPVNVRAWAARNRIPPEYWPGMIALSDRAGIDIDARWLMNTTPARKNAVASQAAA